MPGENPPQRVSLRDIANELGVSHVCVSLALRNSPRISKKRKEEILEIAKRLGYRPDPMLRALAAYRKNKGQVGIHSALAWLNQWEDSQQLRGAKEFDAYWNGALEAAQALGYRLEEFRLTKDLNGRRLTNILKTRNIRGILLPPHSRGISLGGFDWDSFSILRFGFSVQEPHVHLVASDLVGNAIMAYHQMHGLGYKRIGLVTERHFERNTRYNIRAGYRAAQDLYLPPCQQIPPMDLDKTQVEESHQRLKAWLKQYKPDGILTSEPRLQEVLEDSGYRIPDDIGIAGTSLLDVPYDSGIDQNSYEIGRVAIGMLTGFIHENETGLPRTIRHNMVEGLWVQGKSLPPRH
jgi:DNA-binding LacI/PurR family transcriptional regulator